MTVQTQFNLHIQGSNKLKETYDDLMIGFGNNKKGMQKFTIGIQQLLMS